MCERADKDGKKVEDAVGQRQHHFVVCSLPAYETVSNNHEIRLLSNLSAEIGSGQFHVGSLTIGSESA